MSEGTYNILSLLGTWLSGVGALAAALVSLYLARQGSKPRVITSSYLEKVMDAESAIEAELRLFSYNKGYRSVAIMEMKLIIGKVAKHELRIKDLDPKQYNNVTKAVHPGETVSISLPMIINENKTVGCKELTDAVSQVAIYVSKLEKNKLTPRQVIGTLALAIETPDKERFSHPVDYSVVDFFQEHFNPNAREIEAPGS